MKHLPPNDASWLALYVQLSPRQWRHRKRAMEGMGKEAQRIARWIDKLKAGEKSSGSAISKTAAGLIRWRDTNQTR